MHLEFWVEEPSAEVMLRNVLPKVLDETASFKAIVFRGKQDLLHKLPSRLRGYRNWLPSDRRIVILVDADEEDCRRLKDRVVDQVRQAGLRPWDAADGCGEVLCRIAVEELEAWFFGDPEAVLAAYPRMPKNFANRAACRDPDGVRGGTWEAMERLLRRAGYFPNGLNKIELARMVSQHMDPERNRSRSFRAWCTGVRRFAAPGSSGGQG